ncbi:OmpA family protein [Actibacterium sp. 188UL27-1]|uniref:OmpA family protein n=1 Tax=Actibacterium sp. 188UL27-1 TaxID=2786961 RepID=UPI00195AC2C3|nr:OmpA family protein [Actibacterium sp. 188UL27-1]MBM7070201.1 OmpA family protein [Actibacterium sp. 188UL27-1]
MTKHTLKTSTALIASLSLIMPTGLVAQQSGDLPGLSDVCAAAEDPTSCAEQVIAAVTDGRIDLDDSGALPDGVTFVDGALQITPAVPDAETEPTEGAVSAEEPEILTNEAPAATAEVPLEEKSDEDVDAEAMPKTDQTTEEAPTTEAEVTTEPEADQEGQAEAVAEQPQDTPDPTTAPLEENETSEGDGAAATQETGDTTTEDTETSTTAQEQAPDANAAPKDTATEDRTPETAEIETVEPSEPDAERVSQVDTETSTERANEAPDVAASTSTDADETGTVETETVTEADIRSSTQDFDTDANASIREDDDDEGLSTAQKLAIGVAGAAIVGSILKNGDRVMTNSGDRVVVQRDDGGLQVLKDDDVLLRRPGSEVQTRTFDDGSTLTTVLRPDNTRIVTIRDFNGQVLRRTRILPDGREIVLFDDTRDAAPVEISELPQAVPKVRSDEAELDDLRAALQAQDIGLERRFTLQQIRQIRAVRELAPEIELTTVTFETGSAAIRATEAEELRDLGVTIRQQIADNPGEVFLIEGHTDAVGDASYNLALSDRRAESVALALTEYFDVPPENMIVQGYGEANLKVVTSQAERLNRRASVRRITDLLSTASLR